MKKIPTLFVRYFAGHRVAGISDEVTDGFEWVLQGEGIATIKYDGSCCAIIDGNLYKRYDAKKGKKPPEGAIPCCEPDPITGHWPHWVKCSKDNPADKWFWEAYSNTPFPDDGTYEAVGKHFQDNPYEEGFDYLVKHGEKIVHVERTFEGIRDYLKNNHEKIETIDFKIPGIGFDYIRTDLIKEKKPILKMFKSKADEETVYNVG